MRKLYTFFKNRIAVTAVFFLLIVSVFSCNKSNNTDTPPNAKFIGNWVGADCTSATAYEYIGKGADDISVKVGVSVGVGACAQAYPVIGIVNGYFFTIEPTTLSDACGASYLVGGTGTLSASGTFTLTLTGATSTPCTFIGVKE